VAKALAQLPAEFREVLVLFYMQELKYREIAELTQTPIGTVMSRIARGKAILRKSLQGMIPASLDNPQAKENRDGPR
jgi:RNA polymerase sigma-70 factor (ECF subfamily)